MLHWNFVQISRKKIIKNPAAENWASFISVCSINCKTSLASWSYLSALLSPSADKYIGCKSNTLCPRRQSAAVQSLLLNVIRDLLKQQASFSVSADKTLYCPQGPLLSAPQRIPSQLAFVLIMLEPSSHCAVGSIPTLNWARGDFSRVAGVSDLPCPIHTFIQSPGLTPWEQL